MRMTYLVHIVAGTLGLLAGYAALYAAKGGTVHRKSGMLFVYAMVTMAVFGMTIAVVRGIAPTINVPAALVTFSLVITALTTVRPLGAVSWWLDLTAMLASLAVGAVMLTWGFEAIANGGKRNEMPAFPYFMFGIVGMLAGVGDLRRLRSGPLRGAPRLARHLWRMSFALFIAALSFSVQMAKMLAQRGVHVPGGLVALPMLVVLIAMFYWLWRVRVKRSLQGIVRVTAPEAA